MYGIIKDRRDWRDKQRENRHTDTLTKQKNGQLEKLSNTGSPRDWDNKRVNQAKRQTKNRQTDDKQRDRKRKTF